MTVRSRRGGFSLIEALVALTIAAITLTAVFELQSQLVRSQERASRVIEQVAAQENALALLRDLNPMETPQGEIVIPDGDTIRWTSEPLGQPRLNTGFPTGDGLYQVQRHAVTVTIERARGAASPPPMTFDRLGYRRGLAQVAGQAGMIP